MQDNALKLYHLRVALMQDCRISKAGFLIAIVKLDGTEF